jgi:hypothetical protein
MSRCPLSNSWVPKTASPGMTDSIGQKQRRPSGYSRIGKRDVISAPRQPSMLKRRTIFALPSHTLTSLIICLFGDRKENSVQHLCRVRRKHDHRLPTKYLMASDEPHSSQSVFMLPHWRDPSALSVSGVTFCPHTVGRLEVFWRPE